MTSKTNRLLLAVALGVGFLVFRLLYAALFGGLARGETKLLELPSFSLPGIFAHISVLGPVYLEPIWANIRLALPFAFSIVIFGVLSLLVTPNQILIFAARAPKFQKLLMAIGIGLIQIPAIMHSTARINRALRLRGESKARALIPILETAVQRALAIAQRISNAKSVETSRCLSMESVAIAGTKVQDFSIKLVPGQCALLTGPTGSGKSSLLRLAAGFEGELGQHFTGAVSTFASIGFVAQDPRDQIFGPKLSDEVLPGRDFGFISKAELPVETLSEGEAVQLALLRELAKEPKLLILDEPFAAMDKTAVSEAVQLLANFMSAGGAILIAEHRGELLQPLSPMRFEIAPVNLEPTTMDRKPKLVGSEELLSVQIPNLQVKGRLLATAIALKVHQSEAIAIIGRNGVGKTTLLNEICNGNKPQEIAMVPERVIDFFVTLNLEEELARADKIAKVNPGFTLETLSSIVTEVPDLKLHPRDLSAGNQLALAIAMQLSYKPKILLIDEPVKGFDLELRRRVAETLKCVQETGCAIVFTTHDESFVQGIADAVYRLQDQKLERVSQVMA